MKQGKELPRAEFLSLLGKIYILGMGAVLCSLHFTEMGTEALQSQGLCLETLPPGPVSYFLCAV